MRLSENVILTTDPNQGLTQFGFIRMGSRDLVAETIVSQHDVRCNGISALAQRLSGGNLQKFITGRELGKSPAVLVAAQPTWGVDAGAAIAIHQALLRLAESGAAVVVVSQELDELMSICSRIAVMASGRLGDAEPTDALTPELIGQRMAGAA